MEIENLLSDLIKIQSVNPPGGETEVAKYLKNLFDAEGIPNEIIESAPGRGSFLAYLGEGDKRLLYLSHIDVVPVSEGWDFPPFSGEIKNGYVHGRGALDCKGLVAAEAYAMINLARSGKLNGRLIFAATADEEAGGRMGMGYLVENYKDKLMADFVINEATADAPIRIGNKLCHFITVGEKSPCTANLRARGTSAHGARPTLGDNAVVKMAAVIKGLAEYQPEIILIPEVKQLLEEIVRLQGWSDKVTKSNVDYLISKLDDRVFAASISATTRMTVSPNIIRGGTKGNVVPDSCEAQIDIRVLPGQDKDYVLQQLGPIIGDVEVEIPGRPAPTFSTSDSDYYRLTRDTLLDFLGEVPVVPSILSGATDSRYLRQLGIPCYGLSTIRLDPDPAMKESIHSENEKMDIASLRMESDFLTALARKYLGD